MERVNNYLFTFNYTFEVEGNFTFSVFYLETEKVEAKYYQNEYFQNVHVTKNKTEINKDWGSNGGPSVRL